MTKITNNGREPLDFVTGTKDGEPITEALRPGETKDIDVDLDSAQVQGRIVSGLISVDKRSAAKVTKTVGDATSPAA